MRLLRVDKPSAGGIRKLLKPMLLSLNATSKAALFNEETLILSTLILADSTVRAAG